MIHQLTQSTVPAHKQTHKQCEPANPRQTRASTGVLKITPHKIRSDQRNLQLMLTSKLFYVALKILTRTCCPWFVPV